MRPVAACIGVLALLVAACGSTRSADRPQNRWVDADTGMAFIRVEPGEFLMGSPLGEPGRESQEQRHLVRITRPFWLGAFEVTQREWQTVMGSNPSWFQNRGDQLPVENVTWFEVKAFIDRLNARGAGLRFRLPTEAEWEYACRAGTQSAYSTGAALTHDAANFARSPDSAVNQEGSTMPVGSFPPNPWGFSDMHGNVWEWTEDQHCPYAPDEVTDPVGSCAAPLKVIRGGSFYFGQDSARCGLRYTHRPQDRGFSLGVRIARD